jgi:hypothetical protein
VGCEREIFGLHTEEIPKNSFRFNEGTYRPTYETSKETAAEFNQVNEFDPWRKERGAFATQQTILFCVVVESLIFTGSLCAQSDALDH